MSNRMTKKEHRAALKRVIAFRAEFAAKPYDVIDFDRWLDVSAWCGSVGCLGGFDSVSPLFAKYLKDTPATLLAPFFGLTHTRVTRLFEGRLKHSIPDKQEALDRLDGVIKFHKQQLAKV